MADPDETLAKAIAAAIARYEEGGGSDVWRGAARAAVAAVRAAGWVPTEKRNDGTPTARCGRTYGHPCHLWISTRRCPGLQNVPS